MLGSFILVIYMHRLWVLFHCVPHAFLYSLLLCWFVCFGFRVVVVVELNCEIHIAHNLKIKILKVEFVYSKHTFFYFLNIFFEYLF